MKIKKFSLGICIALTIAACSTNKSEESNLGATDSVASNRDAVADLSLEKAKLVKTADLDFQVKDVYKSSSKIQQNVKTLGGLVMHTDIKTSTLNSKTIPLTEDSVQVISSHSIEAEMTVRVPSENIHEFVQAVASDATLIYTSKLAIEDRSIDYLGDKMKQQARQNLLNKELNKDTLKTKDMLALADQQDAIIDGKMMNRRTDASVKYSTISLRFTQNNLLKKEIVANDNLNSYQSPFHKRFTEALHSGSDILVSILIGIVYIWPFILFGLGGFMAYRFVYKKNKSEVKPA
jgi:hypothetical protein